MIRDGLAFIFSTVAGAFVLTAALMISTVASRNLPSEISIRSEESFAADGGPVFNRIRLLIKGSREIWMMNQSHLGLALPKEKWDRLAIVVDREAKTAQFFQFETGPLQWSEGLKQRDFRVSCALCHSNGPRAIRPAPADSRSIGEWMRVSLWNLKIKMYPRLSSMAGAGFAHTNVPFRFTGHFANTPLKVAVCVSCHQEGGLVARGTLIRQNALAIASMVERGHMPPLGIPLPASQRAELDRFLQGL